jgi:hypothetical protein
MNSPENSLDDHAVIHPKEESITQGELSLQENVNQSQKDQYQSNKPSLISSYQEDHPHVMQLDSDQVPIHEDHCIERVGFQHADAFQNSNNEDEENIRHLNGNEPNGIVNSAMVDTQHSDAPKFEDSPIEAVLVKTK